MWRIGSYSINPYYTRALSYKTLMQTNAKIASTTSNTYYTIMTIDKILKLATLILLIVYEPEIT